MEVAYNSFNPRYAYLKNPKTLLDIFLYNSLIALGAFIYCVIKAVSSSKYGRIFRRLKAANKYVTVEPAGVYDTCIKRIEVAENLRISSSTDCFTGWKFLRPVNISLQAAGRCAPLKNSLPEIILSTGCILKIRTILPAACTLLTRLNADSLPSFPAGSAFAAKPLDFDTVVLHRHAGSGDVFIDGAAQFRILDFHGPVAL